MSNQSTVEKKAPPVSFRPTPEVAEAIRAAAKQDRRRVSQFLALLVEDALLAKPRAAAQPQQQSNEAA